MSSTLTLGSAIDRFGVDVHEHLDRGMELPVLAGLQVQGDVIFIPARPGTSARAQQPVPAEGLALVRGEAGGNTHLLLAAGPVTFASDQDPTAQQVGVITVPDGAEAFVAHPEHGYLGLGAGTYLVRRQREQADIIRRVAD